VRQAEKFFEGGGINVSTLERAIAIAAEAHAGQVDKAGALDGAKRADTSMPAPRIIQPGFCRLDLDDQVPDPCVGALASFDRLARLEHAQTISIAGPRASNGGESLTDEP
jgi:hypothetical protein